MIAVEVLIPAMIINHVSRLLGERRESVADLARATGLSYPAAYAIYKGEVRQIGLPTLEKLCRHFGVGPGEILEWRPDGADGADGAEGAAPAAASAGQTEGQAPAPTPAPTTSGPQEPAWREAPAIRERIERMREARQVEAEAQQRWWSELIDLLLEWMRFEEEVKPRAASAEAEAIIRAARQQQPQRGRRGRQPRA
jgi:putative transcriptional regulator